MFGRTLGGVCLATFLATGTVISAQEGHPMVGSWHGTWSVGASGSQDLTLIVDYTPDGAGITGLANPGYDHATLQNFVVEFPKPTDWIVKFEVELKDKAGKPVRYAAEGKLDKIGSDRRTLTGSWTSGAAKGTFEMTRDRDYSR
jgi:hypothetical protein